jgi:hypothetical protein
VRSQRVSPSQKRLAISRANECCEYCGSKSRFSAAPFSVEHVIPRAAGGTDDPDNLALACGGCNGHKCDSAKGTDPVTGRDVSLYHPRRERWAEHFAWSADFDYLIGMTATGRATIEKLKLNRLGVVELRRALRGQGEHPPQSFRPQADD